MADGNILNKHRSSVANIAQMALNAVTTNANANANANATSTGNKKNKFKLKNFVIKQQNQIKLEESKKQDEANANEGLDDFDWWDTMIDSLDSCKNRDFIGFYGKY